MKDTDKVSQRLALLDGVNLSTADIEFIVTEIKDLERVMAELEEFGQDTPWISHASPTCRQKGLIMVPADILELNLTDLSRLIAAREVSSSEATRAALARLEQLEDRAQCLHHCSSRASPRRSKEGG